MVRQMASRLILAFAPVLAACAHSQPAAPDTSANHGQISNLSTANADARLCDHRVPEKVCTRHHPDLVSEFKAANDWCGEHGVPESQCFACHPNLSFAPMPALPPEADVVHISENGEDVASLEAHLAPGKVTVFDFYATWCAPCKEIERHMRGLLAERTDIAIRKLNVTTWDTPVAKHYLADVPSLPFVIVYGKDGNRIAAISGLDLAAIDRAIAEGS